MLRLCQCLVDSALAIDLMPMPCIRGPWKPHASQLSSTCLAGRCSSKCISRRCHSTHCHSIRWAMAVQRRRSRLPPRRLPPARLLMQLLVSRHVLVLRPQRHAKRRMTAGQVIRGTLEPRICKHEGAISMLSLASEPRSKLLAGTLNTDTFKEHPSNLWCTHVQWLGQKCQLAGNRTLASADTDEDGDFIAKARQAAAQEKLNANSAPTVIGKKRGAGSGSPLHAELHRCTVQQAHARGRCTNDSILSSLFFSLCL